MGGGSGWCWYEIKHKWMELCFCFYDLVNNVLVIAGYITGPMRETLLTLSQLGDTGDLSLSLQGRDSTGEEAVQQRQPD